MDVIIAIEEANFRQFVEVKPQGSVTLGFLRGNLSIGIDKNDPAPAEISLDGMTVRLTVEGKPWIESRERVEVDKETNQPTGRRFPYWRFFGATQDAVIAAVFALPRVRRARIQGEKALEERIAADEAKEAAGGSA